jgi:DNA (cytosine-5)-methyltransferase 1
MRAAVVDLFCGIGGLSYGFKREGFQVKAGVDS